MSHVVESLRVLGLYLSVAACLTWNDDDIKVQLRRRVIYDRINAGESIEDLTLGGYI